MEATVGGWTGCVDWAAGGIEAAGVDVLSGSSKGGSPVLRRAA